MKRSAIFRKSVADYRKVVEIDPPCYASFYVNLGFLCTEIGDNEGGIFYYSKAIQIEPKKAELYYHRACTHDLNNNTKQAFLDASSASYLMPNEFLYNDYAETLRKKLQRENSEKQ